MEIAKFFVIQNLLPTFQNPDEQKVFGQKWADEYLSNKNPIYELKFSLRQYKMTSWSFKELQTNQMKSKRAQLMQKIVMKYAAIFRTGIFCGDKMLEEGLFLLFFSLCC